MEAGPVSGAVVGRFAPSPSGRLHLGNLACSLLAWLSAKSQGGRIVLRIEDLDAERCPRIYADLLEQDLAWLGLVWDEGGSTGGPHGPYYQSECATSTPGSTKSWKRRALCTPASVPAPSCTRPARPTPRTGKRHLSRHLPGPDRRPDRRKAQKEGPGLPGAGAGRGDHLFGRLHGPPHGELAAGLRRLLPAPGGRRVRLSAGRGGGRCPHGGQPRWCAGRDLLSSTARQLYLYRLLGLQAPTFAHCPLLLAPDGRRLSKRDGDQSLENLREKYTAQEIVGKLAYAYGLQPEPAPCTPESLISGFSWAKVPKQDVCLPEGLF